MKATTPISIASIPYWKNRATRNWWTIRQALSDPSIKAAMLRFRRQCEAGYQPFTSPKSKLP